MFGILYILSIGPDLYKHIPGITPVGYRIGIISAIAVFVVLWIGGRFAIQFLVGLLYGLSL